jgi:FdrA protein
MNQESPSHEKINLLLNSPIIAVNIGVKSFADNLELQKIEVVHVNWRPPAGGDQEMMDILEDLL